MQYVGQMSDMNGMFGFVENITIFGDMTDPPKLYLLLQKHTVTLCQGSRQNPIGICMLESQ